MRARAARKLDFAFSVEIGLKTTKFAPNLNAACRLVRASTMAIAMDLLLCWPERTLCRRPKLRSSLQSMISAVLDVNLQFAQDVAQKAHGAVVGGNYQ